jgi:ABC-2 type transport system ATP-binding protein
MIEVQSLTKVFRAKYFSPRKLKYVKGENVAVDHVSFNVKDGEIFGFLGPNGAGKTTTIKMLTGIMRPDFGTVKIGGMDIRKNPIEIKYNIGIMPEKPGYYEQLKGDKVLDYYGQFFGIPARERKKRIKDLMELVELKDVEHTKAGDYSFGMKKRLALAQALLHDPDVLILDEPTGGLDPLGTHFFRNLILKLAKEGKTIFLSSHILPEVQHVCNRVGILHEGKLIGVDTIPNLMKRVDSKTIVDITVWSDNLSDDKLEELAEMEEIVEIHRYNLGIDIKAVNKPNISAVINRRLVELGADVRELTTSQPDLEDIFINLVGGEEKKKPDASEMHRSLDLRSREATPHETDTPKAHQLHGSKKGRKKK